MKRLALLLQIVVCSAALRAAEITFLVEAEALPAGDSVYVTGNHPALGDWDPKGLQLLQADGVWRATVDLPPGFSLEYKLTRGSWETEALTEEGRIPGNSTWEVQGDATIRATVSKWKDRDFSPPPIGQRITGTVRTHAQFEGEGLRPRDLLVWLPPGYDTETDRRYPVLYMHDGQQAAAATRLRCDDSDLEREAAGAGGLVP